MALSGTLDTFALSDVLRLLASTAKTGRLRITGDRGSGSIWLDTGEVVATELTSAVSQEPTDAEVVFGLLRFSAGSFTFEMDTIAPNASTPVAVEPVLNEAENLLSEWRAIEKVIPSLDIWVALCSELRGPDVMVDSDRWSGISAIGSGAQVGAVAEALELTEIASCRLVKELTELGLVEIIEEPVEAPPATSFEPEPETFDEETEDEVDDGIEDDIETVESEIYASDEVDDDPIENSNDDYDDDEEDHLAPSDTGTVPSLASLNPSEDAISDPLLSDDDPFGEIDGDDSANEMADVFAGAPAPPADDELDPAEMARQLANLSPAAAKAVAAAARATTDAERDAALAAVEAEDDTVDRGLLLKFLGSVDS